MSAVPNAVPNDCLPDGAGSEDRSLPDLLAPGLLAVFCGINPGLRAAACGHHFAGHGNRFWRTLHLAGFTDRELPPEQCAELLSYRFGLTTVVSRATAGASELSRLEYVDAALPLAQKLERHRPACIAFLGKAAYAAMTQQRHVRWGEQRQRIGPSRVWLLPNPSGRNRAFSLGDLVEAYRALRCELDQIGATGPNIVMDT